MVRVNTESEHVPKHRQEALKNSRSRDIPGESFINQYGRFPFKFKKSPFDPYGSVYAFTQEEEIREQFFYPYIKTGMTVFDIGASVGAYTLPALAMGATVYAFEPDPRSNTVLKASVDLNNFKDFILIEQAVLDKSCGLIAFEELEDVPTTTIDDFGIKPDFIKIDVEGMECRVIDGAINMIIKYNPILLIENHINVFPVIESAIIKKLQHIYHSCTVMKDKYVSYSLFKSHGTVA
jgi:Methyltransferase FkbM domain